MVRKHRHDNTDQRTVKRVCCSLESVLRRKLKIPRQSELSNPYPVAVEGAIVYLEYLLENPELWEPFYKEDPPKELVAVKEECVSPCSPPL